MNLVTRGLPPICTTESPGKKLPFTISLNDGLPTTTLDGARLPIRGIGALTIVSCKGELSTFVGGGLTTVMLRLPMFATSALVIAARNCVVSTMVVGRAIPLTRITAPRAKKLPFNTSVKFPLPAVTVEGAMLVSLGGRSPVPLRPAGFGLFGALSVMVSVPGRLPAEAGGRGTVRARPALGR